MYTTDERKSIDRSRRSLRSESIVFADIMIVDLTSLIIKSIDSMYADAEERDEKHQSLTNMHYAWRPLFKMNLREV